MENREKKVKLDYNMLFEGKLYYDGFEFLDVS